MQQLVDNYDGYNDKPEASDAPIFYMDNVRFSAIVLDRVDNKDIYYIATGKVHVHPISSVKTTPGTRGDR